MKFITAAFIGLIPALNASAYPACAISEERKADCSLTYTGKSGSQEMRRIRIQHILSVKPKKASDDQSVCDRDTTNMPYAYLGMREPFAGSDMAINGFLQENITKKTFYVDFDNRISPSLSAELPISSFPRLAIPFNGPSVQKIYLKNYGVLVAATVSCN